jgi:hypothetical protein
MTEKTHYRKVFKSDHLGVADLEDFIEAGSDCVFTITHVHQEWGVKVAGKKIDANIAYFKEQIKPLVVNAGNSKTLKGMTANSPFVEDWKNLTVQLYINPDAKLKGEIVGGVRISPIVPQVKKEISPDNVNQWGHAIDAYKRDGHLDNVRKRVNVSLEHEKLIIGQCNVE